MQIHQGKTKIWNKGGFVPDGWEDLEAGARMLDPNRVERQWGHPNHEARSEDFGMPCWAP